MLSGHDIAGRAARRLAILFEDELQARFTTADFASALDLVDAIGAAAEAADHHPDLRLSWGRVDVTLSSHDVGGVTQRDVRLAREISDLAGARGASVASPDLSVLELALDTPDAEAIRPFWAAVLGYDLEAEDDEVVDPSGVGPSLWFQESETLRPRPRDALPPRRAGAGRRWPSSGCATPSTPAARWSATAGPRRSGCSPTPRATRPASPPGWAATDRCGARGNHILGPPSHILGRRSCPA